MCDNIQYNDAYYHYLHKAIRIVLEERDDEAQRTEELRAMYSTYFALLEKQKRMEYFIADNANTENLLLDPNLDTVLQKTDALSKSPWHLSLSKGSKYEAESHRLICGEEAANWAILLQEIDLHKLQGKTVCVSVRYRTFAHSWLNVAIRYKKPDNTMVYLATKQCNCDAFENVDSMVAMIPENTDAMSAHVAVYCNKPGQSVQIAEVKLEIGNTSSLF